MGRITSSSKVGILAYGSLIDDPGDEILQTLVRTVCGVCTPFSVEFARSSRTRGGGPTLIPVATGGASVRAAILVLDTSVQKAMDMLWRRETRTSDLTKVYAEPPPNQIDRVRVEQLEGFAGIDLVIYTSIGSNIEPLTPAHLADLAIASVARAPAGKDGISYLLAAKANGIVTALSGAYEAEILSKAGAATLSEALAPLV